MALIGAAFGIGFTFGPLIGYASLRLGGGAPGTLGYAAAGLSLLALLLGVGLLPETRQPGGPSARRKWFDFPGMVAVLRTPVLGLPVLTFFLATFGFGAFEATLALFNEDTLGLTDHRNFLIFAYVGAVLLLTQGFLYRRLATRLSELTLMSYGIVLMLLGLAFVALGAMNLLTGVMTSFPILLTWQLASMTLAVVGFAFLTPSVQALISRRSDAHRQGEILGTNQSASALARILGPLVGLTLYKLHPSHLLPFVFGAVLMGLLLLLLPRIRRDG
jgi:MFS family permease